MIFEEEINLLIRFFKIFILTSALISIIVSCNDDISSIGSDLLPNKDIIDILFINSEEGAFEQESKYYTDSLSLNTSRVLLLGKHDNVESTMMMKFFIFMPDSIKDAVNDGTLEILSSTMEIEPIYTYANKSNYFDFNVHKINSSWNSLTFDKDSLSDLSYDDFDLSSNRNYSDTLITFDFNKELTQDWLKYSADEEQANNNNGIYFNYEASSDKVVGFPAISYEEDNKLARLKIVVEVPGSFLDTMVVDVTSDVHVVLGDLPVGNQENIFIQGGIVVRANLMMDVSKIPDNTIINKATLTLSYDESESLIGTLISDSLGVAALIDYNANELNEDLYPTLLKREGSVYSGDITRFVQSWVSTQENHGLQIFLVNEIISVNKVALKGASPADQNLKPYLEVIYTSKR